MRISPKQQKHLEELTIKYDLKLVLLFGSQVTGYTHSESDIDLAILPEKRLSPDQEYRLMGDLVILFGDRVDYTNIRRMFSPVLRDLIDHCTVLYQKDNVIFHRLESYALQQYAEQQPIFEIRSASLKRSIEQYDQFKLSQTTS